MGSNAAPNDDVSTPFSLNQPHHKHLQQHDHIPTKTIETITTDLPPLPPANHHVESIQAPSTPRITSPSDTTISPITSPPYWAFNHARTFSNLSSDTAPRGGITLKDNELPNDDNDVVRNASICWARGVEIDDYTIVNGTLPGIGAFVVWNVTIETTNGQKFVVRKRYSEFDDLRDRLLMTFPLSEGAMPPLPPKGVVSKFRPKFLEHRRLRLAYFLHCILLNPEFASSPVLKEFLFES